MSTTKYLRENGIKTSFVNKVILTHCHSDHDSGLLRKILDGEKMEVFTTKTINESYKRKMKAITGLKIEDFYDFHPVPIGKPMRINGASFEFDYSFHTIPTIRFKVHYGEKSLSYSSDTQWNPEVTKKLYNIY
jgi:ribonuclease BN (tRNA processing enzyme)